MFSKEFERLFYGLHTIQPFPLFSLALPCLRSCFCLVLTNCSRKGKTTHVCIPCIRGFAKRLLFYTSSLTLTTPEF